MKKKCYYNEKYLSMGSKLKKNKKLKQIEFHYSIFFLIFEILIEKKFPIKNLKKIAPTHVKSFIIPLKAVKIFVELYWFIFTGL